MPSRILICGRIFHWEEGLRQTARVRHTLDSYFHILRLSGYFIA